MNDLSDAEKAEVAVQEVLLGQWPEIPAMAVRDRLIGRLIGKLCEKSVLTKEDVANLLDGLRDPDDQGPPAPMIFPRIRIR
jgi:hypothetical protein